MVAALGSALAVACGDSGSNSAPSEPNDPGEEPMVSNDGAFESSSPGGEGAGGPGAVTGADSAGASESAGASANGAAPPGAEPGALVGDDSATAERAIEEADIVKLDGNRLYALSQYGGLSVIDVSNPDALRLLGRHKVMASPFEMYVENGVAFVLYNGYGEYQFDEATETYTWYQTSYLVALDAREPAAITEQSRFPIKGYISDSRIVGDALYVVAYEDGYCWQCENGSRTNLMSIDVSRPNALVLVDELSFPEVENGYGWKKSLASTTERLYIAGPAWGATEQPEGSVIQVVDIAHAGGDMELGATVEVGGQIESRWQMDEHDGILRVISQPFTWRTDQVPVIETFEIESSHEIAPLAALPMVLPRPERLQSVRFDGDRAYAITFEQTDPLFTIDLENPAAPVQAGELEIPGWVYYMHPAGDRVVGLGFDQGNEAGGLTVSLFDVSDLSTPTMLDRVNFGGEWGWLAEDQDRIHKAFNVLDEENLILVPFSGWSYDEVDEYGCSPGEYLSGIQLVEWDDQADTLALGGIAPSKGNARRGFLHDGTLFAMSDDRLETFDIADRNAPASRDTLPLALRVDRVAGHGDTMVTVGYDWWTNVVEVTTGSVSDPASLLESREVEMPELSNNGCYGGSYLSDVLSSESATYFVYQEYSYDPSASTNKESTRIITVDTTNPDGPSVVGNTDLGFVPQYYYGYAPGLVWSGTQLLNSDSTLVLSNHEYTYNQQGYVESQRREAVVVDMSTPAEPHTTKVPLPHGVGATGLMLDGKIVATSHYQVSPTNPDRVRFYLDRIDISDAANPELLPPVNIPGSLLAYDATAERAVTVDYRTVDLETTMRACHEQERGWFEYPSSNYDYETARVTCHTTIQTLRLVAIADGVASVVDSIELERGEAVGATALGEGRLFVALGGGYYGYGYAVSDVAFGYGYYSSFAAGKAELVVLGGIRSGAFEMGRLELETGNNYYGSLNQLVAAGDRAVVATGWQGSLTVVDASDASAPVVVREVEVPGYVQGLTILGNTAVASLGYDGVQTIAIE